MTTLWIARPVELADEVLSPAERRYAAGITHQRRRREFRTGRLWLRRVLADRLRVDPAGLDLVIDAYGKPRLAGGAPHFNLSHTLGWCVLAISGRPVGVDVEHAARPSTAAFRRAAGTAHATGSAGSTSGDLVAGWVVKEAYTKALGLGHRIAFSSLTTRRTGPDRWVIDGDRDIAVTTPEALPGYVVAVAHHVEEPLCTIHVEPVARSFVIPPFVTHSAP